MQAHIPLQPLHHFVKWIDPFVISQALADSFGALSFQLSMLPQWNSFQALFNQYRLVKVEMFFRPMFRANAVSLSAAVIPLIWVAADINDVTPWTTIDEAQSFETVTNQDDSGQFAIIVKPKVALPAFGGSMFNSYLVLNEDPWVDTDSADAQYYGVKWAVSGTSNPDAPFQQWNVTARTTWQFRLGR